MSVRPAVRHAGAALRSLVTKEASLDAFARSVAHKAQVPQQWSFTARPPGGFSHVPPLSPLLCRVLLRRSFAALAASTVTIVSAFKVVVAVAAGSRIDDSFLLPRLRWLLRDAAGVSDAAQAALWWPLWRSSVSALAR
tara:strand:- start:209 stop:622 length:414 start_codon:yes stop_codon:yes gene_type:complete